MRQLPLDSDQEVHLLKTFPGAEALIGLLVLMVGVILIATVWKGSRAAEPFASAGDLSTPPLVFEGVNDTLDGIDRADEGQAQFSNPNQHLR